jgi:hypothetical protein
MDQIDPTHRHAQARLCAVVIFLGSVVGMALAYGQVQVRLYGSAGLLLVMPNPRW